MLRFNPTPNYYGVLKVDETQKLNKSYNKANLTASPLINHHFPHVLPQYVFNKTNVWTQYPNQIKNPRQAVPPPPPVYNSKNLRLPKFGTVA